MEQTFHFGERIFFNLLCHMAVAQSEFGLDQHGNKFARACLMGHRDFSGLGNDGGIGRASAHIEDCQRKFGSRGCQRAKACHDCFHTRNRDGDSEFCAEPVRDFLHRKFLGFYHRCNADGFFQTGFPGQRTGDQNRRKRVHCQQIGNTHIGIRSRIQFAHSFADAV